MKVVCGIDIDEDKTFISFALLERFKVTFLEEIEIKIPKEGDLSGFLKKNCEILNEKIKEKEKVHSFKVSRVYLNLPLTVENEAVVEETVPLRKRKKITVRDISYIKRYVEEAFLNWDDFCLHHFVLNYEIEGKIYRQLPLGLETKKIKIVSHLVWIKNKLNKEVRDIFDNLERQFGDFVFSGVSVFSTSFEDSDEGKVKIAVNIGYGSSRWVIYSLGYLDFGRERDFGLKKILQGFEKKFFLSSLVAEEVFERYVTFQEVPYFKEISIKDGENYLNLSTQAVNSFLRDYMETEIKGILGEIEQKLENLNFFPAKDELTISFTGRLNKEKGFYNFLRKFVPYNIKIPSHKSLSSSFGCLRYGSFPFLERISQKEQSFFHRLLNIYRDYF